jgi:cytidylate kinase
VDTHQDPGLASARRIAMVGCIGAGKSTLARTIGELLHLEVFDLDRMWWQGSGYRIVGKTTADAHAMDPQAFRRVQEDRFGIQKNGRQDSAPCPRSRPINSMRRSPAAI